jgi:hypothetical protein
LSKFMFLPSAYSVALAARSKHRHGVVTTENRLALP